MAQIAAKPAAERRLTLAEIVDWLVEDGALAREPAEVLKKERRYWRGTQHPLTLVAEENWKDLRAPHKPLTLDWLAEWLAARFRLEYLHIDPLKINFSVVTEVMSSAYATRFRILPVALTAKEVVVATAEPYVREWEPEIARLTRREIRRVIGNPVSHRALPGRVLQPRQVDQGRRPRRRPASRACPTSSSWSSWAAPTRPLDANDAHIVKVVDWLWQYAFEQRASDIHIEPRREAGPGALPHRRRAAPGVPDPGLGARGDDQPHQDPRRAWTWWRSAGRRTGASRRAPPTAAKSSCACRRCRPLSARSW